MFCACNLPTGAVETFDGRPDGKSFDRRRHDPFTVTALERLTVNRGTGRPRGQLFAGVGGGIGLNMKVIERRADVSHAESMTAAG